MAQEDAFGDEANPRLPGRNAVEPDLVAHLVPEPPAPLLGDAGSEHARGKPARLEHDHLAVAQQAAIQQHLRRLRRFSRACRRLEDDALVCAERRDQRLLELADGQAAHRRRWGFFLMPLPALSISWPWMS